MTKPERSFSMKVASIELMGVRCDAEGGDSATDKSASDKRADEPAKREVHFSITVRGKSGETFEHVGQGESHELALADLISNFCVQPISISSTEVNEQSDEPSKIVVIVREAKPGGSRAGAGRYVTEADKPHDLHLGLVVAALRAASHAGLLKADYRANNQKSFRSWSKELCDDLLDAFELGEAGELQRLEAEGIILEQMNRVASAAVVTATNYPRPDSVLSLFDTSAWLFDSRGRRRDAYTDTNLWLAWYPGIENDELTVDEVIESMPQSPPTKIPFIVRLFENPKSWIRFRGAVDLEDHDVMHVLLGRGLQDQDEAFVLGFAMGTAKKVSWFEYYLFKFVLARLYPEPYRIPKYLQPAFDLGVQCGQKTGIQDLYKQELKDLRPLKLAEARRKAGIDMQILKTYYELEQQRIPSTIASLRLP